MNFNRLFETLKFNNHNSRKISDVKIVDYIELQRGNIDEKFPSDFTENEKKLISSVQDYTMTSPERLVSFIRSIDYIEKNKILGDIAECGVWKGGGMMIAAQRLIQLNNQSRKLFLFDTFEGMSEPTSFDVDMKSSKAVDIYENEIKTAVTLSGVCRY